ncbi:MAG TPA: acetylglutamate kinase, partial [Chloroflexota bacterium]
MAEGDAVAEVLVEALPYLNHYAGKTVVVKLGGSLRGGESILQDLALLKRLGIHPVLVHGGGPYITEWLERIGKTTHFVDGLRYTDEETLQVACMVLIGRVNSTLVAQLNGMGVPAMGLSGLDGGLLRAEQRDERYGLVGEVVHVDLRPLMAVTSQGYLPVVAPVALGPNGQPLNVNADTAAGELATALCAEKLIFFTDVPGVQDR